MTKKVIMDIDVDGNVEVKAEGYEGGTCLDATAPFEQLFGKETKARVMTGECVTRNVGERVST